MRQRLPKRHYGHCQTLSSWTTLKCTANFSTGWPKLPATGLMRKCKCEANFSNKASKILEEKATQEANQRETQDSVLRGCRNTEGLYSPLHMSWGWSSTSFLILTWPSSEGREGVDDGVDPGLAIGRSYEEDNKPGTDKCTSIEFPHFRDFTDNVYAISVWQVSQVHF